MADDLARTIIVMMLQLTTHPNTTIVDILQLRTRRQYARRYRRTSAACTLHQSTTLGRRGEGTCKSRVLIVLIHVEVLVLAADACDRGAAVVMDTRVAHEAGYLRHLCLDLEAGPVLRRVAKESQLLL